MRSSSAAVQVHLHGPAPTGIAVATAQALIDSAATRQPDPPLTEDKSLVP
jgi:hypothetical protein